LKLASKLPSLASVASNMTGNRLRETCMHAVKKLDKSVAPSITPS
jgi:hypothetical protein